MSNGWDESAPAWLADMGASGDYARVHVLDPPMLARVRGRSFATALDVGCGEGRFCRMLRGLGVFPVGLDPTRALLEAARQRDPGGEYCHGRAEALPFADGRFDLVVSYLTLIDIADIRAAIAEMARVLHPGGTLLIANLTSFLTAAASPDGWASGPDGVERFALDRYAEERAGWVQWRGIRIRNWHRPLGMYMSLLLDQGLALRHFEEPMPQGGDPDRGARYRRVPWFLVMEWQKPGA